MAFFEFTHTRTYDSDLGWLISSYQNLSGNYDELIKWEALHKIEYQNLKDLVDTLTDNLLEVIKPWDGTIAYRIYTIVSHENVNYIALKDVPAGVLITNTEYWQEANTVINQVNAIAAAVAPMVDVLEAPPINILTLGAKNDGSEDVGAIINTYTETTSLYLPAGDYLVTTPIILKNSLFGAFGNHKYPSGCTRLISNITDGALITINESSEPGALHIDHIYLEGNNIGTAVNFIPSVRVFLSCTDLNMRYFHTGIRLAPTVPGSRWAYFENISMIGLADNFDDVNNSTGIFINNNCADCSFNNVSILNFAIGIICYAGGHRLTSAHIYCSNENIPAELVSSYYGSTRGVDTSAQIMGENVYIDTALQAWVQRANSSIIGNFTYWDDGAFSGTGNNTANILSTRNDATLIINNMVVGGVKTNIANIALQNVIIDNLVCMWSGYESTTRYLPSGAILQHDTIHFRFTATEAGYGEVARLRLASNGVITFRLGNRGNMTRFIVQISGAGTVNTIRKINETFDRPFYYKMDGNDLVIFQQFSAAGTDDFIAILDGLSGLFNGLIDYHTYKISTLWQSDNTDLTLIGT